MNESKPVDLEGMEAFVFEMTHSGGQCSQEFDNWSERHRNNWKAIKAEVESLRERVKELEGKDKDLMALCERLANGIAHMDSCMECGDGTNRDCVYGGQEADQAVRDYGKLIPELNCHGMPGDHKEGDEPV